MRENLNDLLTAAKNVVLTPEEKEHQRRSFAFGNTVIENPRITRARRIVFRDSKTGEFTNEMQRKHRGANVSRSSRPNGATKTFQPKSKKAKAKR